MKHISIIGASAGVGLQTVNKALQEGYHVTTLSRNTDGLPKNPSLTAVQGSATNTADVKKAITGADAVIVAIGTGTKIDWQTISKGTALYTDAATAILNVLKEFQLQVPLIVVTGFGAGDSKAYLSFLLKIMIGLPLRKVYQDKTRMEEMITSGYKNWVIVRPDILTDKPATGSYLVYSKPEKGMKTGNISRGDVADFLLKQAENPTESGHYVFLTGG